jgi:hypothetical protein
LTSRFTCAEGRGRKIMQVQQNTAAGPGKNFSAPSAHPAGSIAAPAERFERRPEGNPFVKTEIHSEAPAFSRKSRETQEPAAPKSVDGRSFVMDEPRKTFHLERRILARPQAGWILSSCPERIFRLRAGRLLKGRRAGIRPGAGSAGYRDLFERGCRGGHGIHRAFSDASCGKPMTT